MQYTRFVLIAADQFLNALLGGFEMICNVRARYHLHTSGDEGFGLHKKPLKIRLKSQ